MRISPFRLIVLSCLSLVAAVVAWCFFLYPAGCTLSVLLDPSVRRGGLPCFTTRWFTQVSKRYARWADDYRRTGRAADAADIASTEWPAFGSVFYLLAAEEMHAALSNDASRAAAAARRAMRPAVAAAAALLVDPVTATWVREKWGAEYRSKKDLFYRMLLIMGLSSHERITGTNTYHARLERQARTLADELMAAPYHVLEDYPGETYPVDVLWAVASIRRADALLGTNHDELVSAFLHAMQSNLADAAGLPGYFVDADRGLVVTPSRGCGVSGMLIFAPELSWQAATNWYHRYEQWFWQEGWCFAGFREHPRGGTTFADVDSGPVFFGYGSVASAFGIGASRAIGRHDRAVPIMQEAVAFSWLTPFGALIPGAMSWLAADGACLGDAALLFTITRPAAEPSVPFTGHAPAGAWLAAAFYLTAGVCVLLRVAWAWRRALRKQ